MNARGSKRRLFTTATMLSVIGAALITSSAGSTAAYKPVIGKPAVTPAQAVAGKRFTVSFKVTRSDTNARLATGTMTSELSVAGLKIPHAKSFRGGTARLSLVVPARAQGKLMKVKLTIRAAGRSATRVATFSVRGAPALSIADATVAEGNAGTTTLSLPVTLSAASAQPVSVGYATSDGSAGAPGDYTAVTGTLTFQPGETTKTMAISIVADAIIEPSETFTVTLSSPVNASIADSTATATITNDDTSVPVTPGSYKGATQEGNYVFLTVTPNRAVTGFRVNDMPETCDGPIALTGGIDWTENTFTIRDDGSILATGSWTGSRKNGDAEWTNWDAKLTGIFNGTSASGTIVVSDELNYKGKHYKCTTGEKKWTATFQG